MSFIRFFVCGFLIFPAAADKSHAERHSGSHLPCQCRALGQMWEQGAEVCLDLGAGRQAFVCDMHQNVTTWRGLGRKCPES